MRRRAKFILPLVVAGGGLLAALGVIAARPDVATRRHEAPAPMVRVLRSVKTDVRLQVKTQGTVTPRGEVELVPEVSGRVVWVSPALVSGGFFAEGEPLLRLDQRDYEIAVESARAAVARMESEVALAKANRRRQQSLRERGVVSAAAREDAENTARVAAAGLREARAALARAELDLERTEIDAPFRGQVRQEQVEVGKFVVRGTPMATLYAIDRVEVRLPIPDGELAFLDVPLEYRAGGGGREIPVILRAHFGGREQVWQGRIARREGEIDARSRMVYLVAEVEDPYGHGSDGARPALPVGLFVEAEIAGQLARDVAVLPRSALRGKNTVWVVDENERLHFRHVKVLRKEAQRVLVAGGLAAGERVCVSPLESVVAGMRVRVAAEGKPGSGVEVGGLGEARD